METINDSKKIVIPTVILLASFYIPFSFVIGLLSGYLATVFFHKKLIDTERLNPVIFNIGNWQVHLHHWIMGAIMLFAIYIMGFLPELSFFWIGSITGIIVHDLYTDDIWYKVIYKEEEDR